MATTTQKVAGAIGAAAAGAAVVGILALNTAALSDSFGPRRIAGVTIECPTDDVGPCIVEGRVVRPPTPAAIAEADAAGLEAPAFIEKVMRRRVTRAALNTFLTNQTQAIP